MLELIGIVVTGIVEFSLDTLNIRQARAARARVRAKRDEHAKKMRADSEQEGEGNTR